MNKENGTSEIKVKIDDIDKDIKNFEKDIEAYKIILHYLEGMMETKKKEIGQCKKGIVNLLNKKIKILEADKKDV